jgi:ABC-type phosphate transport system substrate-binding protein
MNGSLVGATLAQITAEKRNLRFVALDGVMPSLDTYLDGSYPYGKPLYLIAPTVPSAEARAFVDFIVGPAARSRLRDLGLVAGAR